MSETFKLLKAFIEAQGYEIEIVPVPLNINSGATEEEEAYLRAKYPRSEIKVAKK